MGNRWRGKMSKVSVASEIMSIDEVSGVTQGSFLGPESTFTRSESPSGRPIRNVEAIKTDGNEALHLYPKRITNELIEVITQSNNPIETARKYYARYRDKDCIELAKAVICKEHLDIKQLDFNANPKLERLERFLSDDAYGEEMLSQLENFRTFIDWMCNSGYDFIFGPFPVTNLVTEDCVIPGGKCDAIGIRLQDEHLSQEKLSLIRGIQGRHFQLGYLNSADKIIAHLRSIKVFPSKIDVLEFKLGEMKKHKPRERNKHLKQVKTYSALINKAVGDTIFSPRLIYFSDKVEAIDIPDFSEDEFIQQIVVSSRELPLVKHTAAIRDALKKALIRVNDFKELTKVNAVLDRARDQGKISFIDLICITYFAGAYRLVDGSIVVILPGDKYGLILPNTSEFRVIDVQRGFRYSMNWKSVSARELLNSQKITTRKSVTSFKILNNEKKQEQLGFEFILSGFRYWGNKLDINED